MKVEFWAKLFGVHLQGLWSKGMGKFYTKIFILFEKVRGSKNYYGTSPSPNTTTHGCQCEVFCPKIYLHIPFQRNIITDLNSALL